MRDVRPAPSCRRARRVAVLPPGVRADDFPDRPITLVVPFAAGGSIDVLARLAAQQAGAALGQPVLVDNRGGAAGLIGAASVAQAEPDGYTLLMASAAQVTIPPWINRSLTFDPPKDLAPVAHLVDTPMVLIVAANSRMKSVDDFIAEARAHRGGLNYASTGVGTISHLVMETLKLAADIDVVHVPYRGAAPALNDLQAGQVQGMFTSTASVAPHGGGEQAAAARRHDARPFAAAARRADHGGSRLAAAEVVVWAGVMAPAARRGPSFASSSALSSIRSWHPKCASGWSRSAPTRSGTARRPLPR